MTILITLLRSPIGTLAMAEIRAKKMRYDEYDDDDYKLIPVRIDEGPKFWKMKVANEDWEIKFDQSPSKD